VAAPWPVEPPNINTHSDILFSKFQHAIYRIILKVEHEMSVHKFKNLSYSHPLKIIG